jgi:glutaredoxin
MASEAMIKVYQAEWCPHSHKIRQRLTELGLPFVAMPVSTVPEERTELISVSGQNAIPVIVVEDGTVIKGKDKHILSELNKIYDEPPGAEAHRQKVVKNEHKLSFSE